MQNLTHTISSAGHVHGVIYGWMDVFDCAHTMSPQGPGLSNLQPRPKAEFTDGTGWDGMEWDIKSVLQYS